MADDETPPLVNPMPRSSFVNFENPMRSHSPPLTSETNISTNSLLVPPVPSFVERNWSLTKALFRAGTDVETEIAPIYRSTFLLICLCPLGPIVSMIVYPDAPFFELMTQIYFAPMQAAVAIYLVSRLSQGPEMPFTEKCTFGIFVFSIFAQAIQRLQLGRYSVSLTLFGYGLFYIAIYKMLRRLRKRLTQVRDETLCREPCRAHHVIAPSLNLALNSTTSTHPQMPKTEIVAYLSRSVFRTGFASLVPIVYLSSESFGCIAAEVRLDEKQSGRA